MKLVFDIEANGLLNDETIDYTASPYVLKDHYKFHCLVIKNIDTGEVLEYDPDTFKEGVEYIKTNATTLIGHNIVDYDLLALKLGFDFDYTVYPDTICGRPCAIIDTLVLSKTLNPDRMFHSLDYLGKLAGVDKIDWRGKAIELGLIDSHAPKGEEFKVYHPAMLEYNRQDVEVNHKVYDVLMKEWGTWNWQPAFELEMAVRDIVTRQSHRGFYFDVEKAKENVRELDILMQQAREIVEPLLPPCKLSMARASETTPPKIQFKKDGTISANMIKFAEKMGAEIEDKVFKWGGQDYQLPMPLEPLIKHEAASIEDTTHIKGWLVDLGWWPTVYKERDLTVDSKKKKLTKEKYKDAVERYMTQTMESPFKRDRMFHLTLSMKCKDEQVLSKLLGHDLERPMKVYTNPTFTVGQDKELCPKLEEMSEIFPHVYKVVEFLTYRHRRNSILGGGVGIDEDDIEMEKGYLANIRADGRIPTPADTCGCNTSRFKHRIVTNIPRTTSMYGKNMRAMFGVERKKYAQFGYDFSSLEGRMESHYCVPMDTKILTKTGWKDYYGLQNGELVLGYNSQTGEKEWTKVTGKVFYEDAETVTVSMGRQKFTTTQDHRWYVEQRCTQSKTYIPKVITTRELNTGTKVITNAPFNTTQDLSNTCDGISQGKYNVDWVKRVLDMSHNERIAFVEGFMIADGYYHEHKQRPVWRWAQNGGDIFEAALLATYLVHDGNVTVADNDNKAKVKVVTLCRNGRITGQSMKKTDAGIQDVWCPQTELGSWVMRQGNCITITGNCWKYDETKEYCNSLVLEKPFDVHTLTAKKISEILGKEFKRTPAKNVKYCCLPTDNTKVLTPLGWKDGTEIVQGDLVLGYDAKAKVTKWTKVTATHFYQNAEVIGMGNALSKLESTPDHRWYGQVLKQYGSGKTCTKVYEDCVWQTKDLKQTLTITNTAEFVGGSSDVKPHEAALIAWLIADGYYKWSELSESTSCSGGTRKGIVASIGQASHTYQKEVEEVLAANNAEFVVDLKQTMNENTINAYRLKSKWIRDFLDRVVGSRLQKHDVNWTEWVVKLSKESLEAFVHHFWLADGDSKGNFNNTYKTIRQNEGNICDAISTACYLLGGNVTIRGNKKIKTIRMQNRRKHTTTQEFKVLSKRETNVFCLTTELDTFVIQQNGLITITGNCTYGGRPMRVAKTIGSDFTTGKQVYDAFWLAADPLRQLGESLKKYWETLGCKKFVLGIDGRKVPTRSASALVNSLLQSAGVICAKWTMVLHDRKLATKGLTVDFFRDDWKNKTYINQLVAMHDEAQMEVTKSLIDWKIFKEEDEAIAFKKSSTDNWSEVGHIGDKYFVGKSVISDLLLEAVDETTAKLKLNIPLGVEFIYGDSWATCH